VTGEQPTKEVNAGAFDVLHASGLIERGSMQSWGAALFSFTHVEERIFALRFTDSKRKSKEKKNGGKNQNSSGSGHGLQSIILSKSSLAFHALPLFNES